MKVFLIIAAVLGLIAYGAYYASKGDERAIIANAGPKEQQVTVTIGGHEQLGDLIAAGKYDRVDPLLQHASLPSGSAEGTKVELTLLKLDWNFHSKEQALAELEAKGLVPARIEHLLALGAQYPEFDVFNQGSIIFLGSTFKEADNKISVPALSTNNPHELRLYHSTDTMLVGPDDWVAGVKK